MITHLSSADLQALIVAYRQKRDLFKQGSLGFVLELHRIDTLQNLHRSLFDEYFEPQFFEFTNHGLDIIVGNINEKHNDGTNFIG